MTYYLPTFATRSQQRAERQAKKWKGTTSWKVCRTIVHTVYRGAYVAGRSLIALLTVTGILGLVAWTVAGWSALAAMLLCTGNRNKIISLLGAISLAAIAAHPIYA